MRQPGGEIAVVRQEQQAFRVVVETADGVDVVANAPLASRSMTVGRLSGSERVVT